MTESNRSVNIIGAGLSGLSAAITLARAGVRSNLISSQPSERAQSVLAEGGINAALDTMGEHDSIREHFEDTLRGGCYLESEDVIRGLTETAPDIVTELASLGVPFNTENGHILLRNFGGQAKKRTAFAKSSTGKMLMTALIDEVRKHEAEGLIRRYPNHELCDISTDEGRLESMTVMDSHLHRFYKLTGPAIMCTGGLNGMFEGMTTGTTQNTGNAAALAFRAGTEYANLEFIQYHPTTVEISNKRMLISEAARGEGGRLFIMRNGSPWYFMEEKYPKLGNLMPRDVVSREMAVVCGSEGCEGSVYLDMTGIGLDVWEHKLADLRKEIIEYLNIYPEKDPVPVSPGIHYFMGGMSVDAAHRSNIDGLYAAGEAACRYHGANRLGGNSMLGAIYGGRLAAKSAMESACEAMIEETVELQDIDRAVLIERQLREQLAGGLGIIRSKDSMQGALENIRTLEAEEGLTDMDKARIHLGQAMLMSALARKESRGAHTRSDYPDTDDEFKKITVAKYDGSGVHIGFRKADS